MISVEEYETENGLYLFPNPTNNFCNVISKDNSPDMNNATIDVYDLTGKVIVCPIQKSQNTIQLDLQSLTPGLYVVKVVDKGLISVYKVIKT